jgi:phosphohistidine phosphatase
MKWPIRASQSVLEMPDTKQLFVLRHAKSSWDDPGLNDHDRPLAPRGRHAVQALHEYVAQRTIRPSLVLCSSSRRTRETVAGVLPDAHLLLEPELYTATAGMILERLQQVPDETASAMVVGHNPAMQMLVLRLAAPDGDLSEDGDLATVRRKYPTGALATLMFEGSWNGLAPRRARLTGLVRPKDLHLMPRAATPD